MPQPYDPRPDSDNSWFTSENSFSRIMGFSFLASIFGTDSGSTGQGTSYLMNSVRLFLLGTIIEGGRRLFGWFMDRFKPFREWLPVFRRSFLLSYIQTNIFYLLMASFATFSTHTPTSLLGAVLTSDRIFNQCALHGRWSSPRVDHSIFGQSESFCPPHLPNALFDIFQTEERIWDRSRKFQVNSRSSIRQWTVDIQPKHIDDYSDEHTEFVPMYDAPQLFQWKGYLVEVQKGGNNQRNAVPHGFPWDVNEQISGNKLAVTYVPNFSTMVARLPNRLQDIYSRYERHGCARRGSSSTICQNQSTSCYYSLGWSGQFDDWFRKRILIIWVVSRVTTAVRHGALRSGKKEGRWVP